MRIVPFGRTPLLRWLKRLAVVAVLATIAGVIAWSFVPKPVPVETARVVRGPFEVTVDEDGRARVQDRYIIAAPLAGTIARLELHPGDSVAAGAVIARLAPLPSPLLDTRSRAELDGRLGAARARRKQAAATVRRAEAAAAYARTELARAERLAREGAAPGAELDRRRLEADVAARDLDSARFAAAVADDELATAQALIARLGRRAVADEELVVRAPVAGRVLRVFAESEGAIAPGTPLVEIGDPTRLEVVADLLTADAVAVRPGAPVTIAGWGGAPLAGTVRLVEPSATTRISALGVEEQRVAVVVDLADGEQARGLGDGWRVEVRIVTWSGDDVVQVPLGALFRDGDRWAVFIVDDGRAVQRWLELGQRGTMTAEVVTGLAPGDAVILHPTERVTPGVRVTGAP
jgi:HlyD family secretion protein